MLYDDQSEVILNNLQAYVSEGCYPFCVQPDFKQEFDDFILPDRKEVERSLAVGKVNCITCCYNDNVDAKDSGLTRRVHNGNIEKQITKRMGDKTESFMNDVGIKKIGKLSSILYRTTYNPSIREMGKNYTGLCFSGSNNMLMIYGVSLAPLESLRTFYHEIAHTMQHKLKLNKDTSVLDVLEKRLNHAPEDKKDLHVQACLNERSYLSYIDESHAQTFAATMVLLRAKTERQYQNARKEMLTLAAIEMKCGYGAENAEYCSYGNVKHIVNFFDALGKQGRAEYGKINGRFSLDKVAMLTYSLVKDNAMSRADFKNYRWKREDNATLEQKQDSVGYGWVRDYFAANDYMRENAERTKLQLFTASLISAKSQRDIYDVFDIYKNIPQIEYLHNVYLRTNIKGEMYNRIRKAEETLGVDKVLGEMAKARRRLGAQIMQNISGGRC